MTDPSPLPNRKARRSWNAMVRDARSVTTEIPVVDDEVITVVIPDADALTELFKRRNEGDMFGALGVLLGGEHNVDRLREVAKAEAGEDGRVPITAWRDLMNQTMEDLGLGGNPERSPAP